MGVAQAYRPEPASMLTLFLGPGHQALNPVPGPEKLDALGELLDGEAPVSYTHLDVYKRQISRRRNVHLDGRTQLMLRVSAK